MKVVGLILSLTPLAKRNWLTPRSGTSRQETIFPGAPKLPYGQGLTGSGGRWTGAMVRGFGGVNEGGNPIGAASGGIGGDKGFDRDLPGRVRGCCQQPGGQAQGQ